MLRFTVKFVLIITIVAFWAVSLDAQWKLVDDRTTAFDMLNAKTGLMAVNFPFQQLLSRYDNGVITGLANVSGRVTSIIIKDTSIAYVSVRGDGIYEVSGHWQNLKRLGAAAESVVLCVHNQTIIGLLNRQLCVSKDGKAFKASEGIIVGDTIYDVAAYSNTNMIAVGESTIYRSFDGGETWSASFINQPSPRSIYLDTINNVSYIGGGELLRSLDNASHWQTVTNIFFNPLSGIIVGARDCSGAFYLGPDHNNHGDLYRSVNQGKFFQSVGPAFLASTRLRKGVCFDRGSTYFWLDEGDLLSVSHNGVDGSIPDSIITKISISTDTILHSSLCAASEPSTAKITVLFAECTGIVLDSLIPVGFNPAFTITFKPKFLRDSTVHYPYTFHANHTGIDSALFRLQVYSPTSRKTEYTFFSLYGYGDPSPAIISELDTIIDYGNIRVDSSSTHNLVVRNTGCESLRIDSIKSSSATAFAVDSKKYPIEISSGQSIAVGVRFKPEAALPYLEAITVYTSVGSRVVSVCGFGIKKGGGDTLSIQDPTKPNTVLYPNPASDFLNIQSPLPITTIELTDLLGYRYLVPTILQESNHYRLNLQEIPNGSYRINTGIDKSTQLIIIH